MSFSTYMIELREKKKESQASIAEHLGISVTAIKMIETNQINLPSEKLLNSLCEYLNEDKKDVLMHILFTDKEIEKHGRVICKYLAQVYLESWNVSLYDNKKFHNSGIDAKIVKKRATSNISLVADCTHLQQFAELEYVLQFNDPQAFINSAILQSVLICEPFRNLKIIFDNKNKTQKKVYELLEKVSIMHINYTIDAILYDADKGVVIDSKRVKD